MSAAAAANPVATEAPAFDLAKYKQARAEGKPYEAPAPTPGQPEPVVEKRASGDERKFRRLLSRRDQEIGELRAKLEALTPKEQAKVEAAAASDAAPKREDFDSDEAFNDAHVTFLAKAATKQTLDAKTAEESQAKQIQAAITGYNERMARGPEKYDDWQEAIDGGKGAALSIDLSKECPELFWAITISPYNDDCFYAFCKDSGKLQALIDQYKVSPRDAVAAFHRFEGRVGKDEIPAKKAKADETAKADDAVGSKKPKPSSEAQVRAGAPAPSGPPPVTLADGTLNPAWKTWRNQQAARQ